MTDNLDKDSSPATSDNEIVATKIMPAQTELNLPNSSYMERFLAMQQRRIEISNKSSTSRRINEIRAAIVANVEENLHGADEIEALKQCNVDIAQLSASTREAVERGKRKRKRCKRSATGALDEANDNSKSSSIHNGPGQSDKQLDIPSGAKCIDKESSTNISKSDRLLQTDEDSILPTCFGKQPEKRNCLDASDSKESNKTVEKITWQKIRPFLTVNDHLITTTGSGRPSVASHLEEQLESAIQARDLNKAEELSDRLATREFGKRIVGAIEAKRYADEKVSEKEKKAAASKKKLAWGFVQKHRWETKGNM